MARVGLFDIDAMRRRPPGPKLLVYLDQSVVSEMARGNCPELLAVLRAGIETDRLVCPSSPDHADETMVAGPFYRPLTMLMDELSMGICFQSDLEIEYVEIAAAAASFLGRPDQAPIWEGVFNCDPHTPRSQLYTDGYRITVIHDQVDWWEEEVAFQKSGTDKMTTVYEEIRRQGRTFEQQAELEYETLVRRKLEPLVDRTRFAARLGRLIVEAGPKLNDVEACQTPGSPFRRHKALKLAEASIHAIKDRFPELEMRAEQFVESTQLRSCPSLGFIPLLLAGTAFTVGRKAKPSDRYDRTHMMKGLSRCDVVTADGGVVQMCRDRKLIPTGVLLFRSSDLVLLADYLRNTLDLS